LTNALLPDLGDTDLAKLARLALHEIQGLMPFPSSATAMGLAAGAGTFRESAAKEPLRRGELRNPGTEVALGGGELGAVQGVVHVLYYLYIQDKGESEEQIDNANLLPETTKAKT